MSAYFDYPLTGLKSCNLSVNNGLGRIKVVDKTINNVFYLASLLTLFNLVLHNFLNL